MAKNKSNLGAGIGLAALAAAAAGAYYFYGSSKAAKHRRDLKSWAVKAKGEVMERLEQLQNLSQKTYNDTVEEVLSNYKRLKHIKPAELAALGKELKGHWNAISNDIKKLRSPAAKAKSGKRKKRK